VAWSHRSGGLHYGSSRTPRNASRYLILGLSALVGIGAFFYLKNLKSSRGDDAAETAAPATGNEAARVAAAREVRPPSGALLAPGNPATKPVVQVTVAKPAAAKAAAAGETAKAVQAPAQTGAQKSTVPVQTPAPVQASATSNLPPDRLVAEGRVKQASGDLVGARAAMNEALHSNRLSEGDAAAVRSALVEINRKLVFSPQRFAADPHVDAVTVQSAREMVISAKQHAIPWESVCRINGVSDRKLRPGQTLKVPNGPFHAVVDKSDFRLDVYLGALPGESGALFITSIPVGLGKDDSTPTGLWSVPSGGKTKNPHWTNPRTNETFEGNDPKNPLGGFWIALRGEDGEAVGKTSYGIHGTIEPESVGRQASMGCVRLKQEDIALLYDLLTDGKSRVMVRE
jgi:lipoprotein-anchoring transpeptidase ErfK/SrfK